MPVGARRPFTEIFESVQTELVRESASGVEGKYQGIVNQVYLNDLSSVLPEEYIRKQGYITTVANYTTGTVTVGSGTSNIIGSSTSWTSGNSNDFNIKVAGFNRIYRMTFSAGTSLTFQNSLSWAEGSGTAKTYSLFQNRYSLASDFSYLVADDEQDPNVVSFMMNGRDIFIPPMDNDEYNRLYNDSVGPTFSGYTVDYDSSGTIYLKFWPNPSQTDIITYRYIPVLVSLSEYTTGTVTFNTTTAVTVDSGTTSWLVNITTGTAVYYIRNDVDGTGSASKWVKISSVGGTSALTLASAWAFTTGSAQSYTIASESKWPARFDDAILYKTAMIVDPDNVQFQKWQLLYQEAIGLDKTIESKRLRGERLKFFPGAKR